MLCSRSCGKLIFENERKIRQVYVKVKLILVSSSQRQRKTVGPVFNAVLFSLEPEGAIVEILRLFLSSREVVELSCELVSFVFKAEQHNVTVFFLDF